MYEFIFLGLVPGTHLQVTFSAWLCIAGVVMLAVLTYRTKRSRTLHFMYMHGRFAVPGRRQHEARS